MSRESRRTMTTLIYVCLSTIATIVEKVVLVKSNKDKASRLGKKCEGWKVILAELQAQEAELPQTAEVNIMAIRDALVRNRSNLRAPLDVNEHRRRSLSFVFSSWGSWQPVRSITISSSLVQERADKLIDKCMKKKIFGSAAQTRQFLEVSCPLLLLAPPSLFSASLWRQASDRDGSSSPPHQPLVSRPI